MDKNKLAIKKTILILVIGILGILSLFFEYKSYSAKEFQNYEPYVNYVNTDTFPGLYATYEFSGIPVNQNLEIVSSDFNVENYYYVISGVNEIYYDSSKEGTEEKIHYALDEETYIFIEVYQLTEDENTISLMVNNTSYIETGKYATVCAMVSLFMMLGVLIICTWIDVKRSTMIGKKVAKIVSVITLSMLGISFFLTSMDLLVNILLYETIIIGIFRMVLAIGQESDNVMENHQNNRRIIAMVLAIAGSMTLLYFMLTSEEGSLLYYFNSVNKANLKDYMIVLFLTIILYIVFAFVLEKVNKRFLLSRTELINEGFFVLTVICLGLIRSQFAFSEEFPNWLWFVFTIGVVILLLEGCKWQHSMKSLVYMSYVFTIIVWVLSTGVINIFISESYGYGTGYNVHHAGAYLEPLYYIVNGLPFAGGQMDLYGHYALFFLLPMKIFGSNSLVIGIMMGIVGGLTALFSIGTIHKLVKNDFVRIMGAVAVLLASYQSAVYWQTYPHRLLFSTIIMFYAACCKDKKLKAKECIIGYILCTLAVLWNTESGVVCGLAWAVYVVLRKIQGIDNCFIKAVKVAIQQIIVVLAEVVVAFAIVKVYNFIASGYDASYLIESKGELGVLTESSYMINFHQTLLTWSNSRWIYILICLLGVLLYSLAKTGLAGKAKDSGTSATIGTIAILGLGLFTFFINRVAAGSGIVALIWCIVLAIILDKVKDSDLRTLISIKSKRLDLYNGVKVLLKVLVIFYFTGMLLSLNSKIDAIVTWRIENGSYDYEAYKEELEEFEELIPKDTYARGNALSVIYMNLGWDMQLDEEDAEYMVLVSTKDESLIPVQTVDFGGYTYTLYYNPNYKK